MIRLSVAVGVLGALTLGASAEASSPASIRPVGLSPLEVQGSHFAAREKVTVLVSIPGHFATRHVVASTVGSFSVVFRGVDFTKPPLRIRAMGSKGHAAIWSPRGSRISPPNG